MLFNIDSEDQDDLDVFYEYKEPKLSSNCRDSDGFPVVMVIRFLGCTDHSVLGVFREGCVSPAGAVPVSGTLSTRRFRKKTQRSHLSIFFLKR